MLDLLIYMLLPDGNFILRTQQQPVTVVFCAKLLLVPHDLSSQEHGGNLLLQLSCSRLPPPLDTLCFYFQVLFRNSLKSQSHRCYLPYVKISQHQCITCNQCYLYIGHNLVLLWSLVFTLILNPQDNKVTMNLSIHFKDFPINVSKCMDFIRDCTVNISRMYYFSSCILNMSKLTCKYYHQLLVCMFILNPLASIQ